MGTPWDAETYDRTSKPQQRWANEVISRVVGVDHGATVLDVGCGTGRVTEHLARLVRVRLPLDYVRLNISAVRDGATEPAAS